MELKIKLLSPQAVLPQYATPGSAAMDLTACMEEPITLAPRQLAAIPTGIAIALPSPEYVALVFARSGLGVKHGISLSNGVGVIDSDYRGPVTVVLHNHGEVSQTVFHGDRIAQMVITPVLTPAYEEAEDLADTGRGQGGFGSTGK